MNIRFILMILGLVGAQIASAADSEPCANFAKYGAIRTYKAEMGFVQGSEGIEYTAKLLNSNGQDFYEYLVTIYDNNEDGDVWEVDYNVVVKGPLANNKCQVVSVKKGEIRSEGEE